MKDNIKKICTPIKNLTELLVKHGFKTEKKELSDFHFNEFKIIMKGSRSHLPNIIDIEIEKYSESVYRCKCHYSAVEIIFDI